MASRTFRAYHDLLTRRPLLIQSLTAGTLYAVGDVVAQGTSAAISPEANNKWDWKRTSMMTAIGGLGLGPCMALWYRFLQHRIRLQSHARSVLARVVLDQAIFAPVSIVGLYYSTELLKTRKITFQGRIQAAHKKLRESFVPVLTKNYMLWPAVSYINFFYVPLHYRLLVSNTVAVFWSAFLSLVVNKPRR